MNKILYLIIFLLISNCAQNKVVKHHGVHFLDKKQEKLVLSSTNINDILVLLGPPSTKSTFDNDIFIYIERKSTNQSMFKFGKEKIIVNNVLVLEINYKGLLVKKDFYDIHTMNKLTFTEKSTEKMYSKKSFVYDFLSSMRQKINDPLGKRRK